MDILALHDVLGRAYGLDQIDGNRSGAIAFLRERFVTPEARAAASSHRDTLDAVAAAREQGGSHGCHVTRVSRDLISEALREPA